MTAMQKQIMPDFTTARVAMVESQLLPNQVTDARILDAMGNLAREDFVPSNLAPLAYSDSALAVAPHRYLLEPMIQARIIQAAQIKPSDRVLDIGCLGGYSTSIIARMAHNVVGLESDLELGRMAGKNIANQDIKNAKIISGALAQGWGADAPYNVIVINGAISELPNVIVNQLADAGRIVAIAYQENDFAIAGQGRVYELVRGTLSHRDLFNAFAKPLAGFTHKKGFQFS